MAAADLTLISTETGTLARTGDWDFPPSNRSVDTWDELRQVTNQLLPVAEECGVTMRINAVTPPTPTAGRW